MNKSPILLSNDPGVGRVWLCNEQCIHLTIGPITLNLSPVAFAEAATLVRNAMDQLSKLIDSPESRADREEQPNESSARVH